MHGHHDPAPWRSLLVLSLYYMIGYGLTFHALLPSVQVCQHLLRPELSNLLLKQLSVFSQITSTIAELTEEAWEYAIDSRAKYFSIGTWGSGLVRVKIIKQQVYYTLPNASSDPPPEGLWGAEQGQSSAKAV